MEQYMMIDTCDGKDIPPPPAPEKGYTCYFDYDKKCWVKVRVTKVIKV